MASCTNNQYIVRHADNRKTAYNVPRNRIVSDRLDITLIGKSRLEYGEVFNKNIFNILENFACPSDDSNNAPDLTIAHPSVFNNPTEGQFWFDNKNFVLFRYQFNDGVGVWVPLSSNNDIAGLSGVWNVGVPLPRPVSQVTGHVFDYSECCWIVSPYFIEGEVDYMRCLTDVQDGVPIPRMLYRLAGTTSIRSSPVNYQIIGIRGMIGGITGPLPQDVVFDPIFDNPGGGGDGIEEPGGGGGGGGIDDPDGTINNPTPIFEITLPNVP